MKYFKLSIIAIATAALMTACGQKDKTNTTAPTGQDVQKAAPVVSVVTAQAEDVDITNTFTSNVEPYATNNIVSQTAGRIVSIKVEVGDKVRKGQLLATMDDVNLAKTRMQYVNDSTELARLTELYNIGAVAQFAAAEGTASWDCCDASGERVTTGNYSVYASQTAVTDDDKPVAIIHVIK